MKRKYTHTFDLCFNVWGATEEDPGDVPMEDVLDALTDRVEQVKKELSSGRGVEWQDIFGVVDTTEED